VRLREGGEAKPRRVTNVKDRPVRNRSHPAQSFISRCHDRIGEKEFDLLGAFAESPERVFSRDEILNKVWGYEVFPTARDGRYAYHASAPKDQDELIETVRSVGYRFKDLVNYCLPRFYPAPTHAPTFADIFPKRLHVQSQLTGGNMNKFMYL